MEPVAIIGLSCRFPGANSPAEFWRLLCEGREAIREVPPDRWDVDDFYDPDLLAPGKINTRRGGFLDEVDKFDPLFFRISPREAAGMDPQQRLMLELAWEGLEDASLVPAQLRGSRTGVFVAFGVPEYHLSQLGQPARINGYTNTGFVPCILANRVSYVFDFRGPSLALDTACSSSLVAIHLACQSLRGQEATLALAGGVNLMISPLTTVGYSKLRALAPDGRCKAFDARADGYVRGEGGGLVVLKLLSAALADGDRVYAVIRGSAVNQDGQTNGLTAPNRFSQEDVLRRAYTQAGVSPADVQYVETHGTGTLLGDPIEATALGAVLAPERAADRPCAIGSVKTNIGHLEGAAGVASAIKVALSIHQRQIPPSLHFETPNPHIPFDNLRLEVQKTLTPWPAGSALAGVSAFGFGGTNAHLVVSEAPPIVSRPPREEDPEHPHLFPLSAHSPEALRAAARSWKDWLKREAAGADVTIGDLCAAAALHRSHHDHRLGIVAEGKDSLLQKLEAFLVDQPTTGVAIGRRRSGQVPPVTFLFGGEGSYDANADRQLSALSPVYQEARQRCEECVRPLLEHSPLGEAATARGALFSLQYSLVQLWKVWGVAPVVVMGQHVGEYVAACVAGILSVEDALKLLLGDPNTVAEQVVCSAQHLGFVAGHTGELAGKGAIASDYWRRHAREPSDPAVGLRTLHELGAELFLEIGPRPALIGLARECLPENKACWLPSLSPERDAGQQMLETLSALYVRGLEVHWPSLYRSQPSRRLSLPLYPFQRERFWWDQIPDTDGPAAPQPTAAVHPLLGERLRASVPVFECCFDRPGLAWLNDHRVHDRVVVSASAWLEMALAAIVTEARSSPVGLRDVVFDQMLLLSAKQRRTVQLTLLPADGDGTTFEIHSLAEDADPTVPWMRHARGWTAAGDRLPIASSPLSDLRFRIRESISPTTLAERLRERGLHYGPAFQCVERLWRRDREALGKLQVRPALAEQATAYRVFPGLLDAAFQMVAVALPANLATSAAASTYVPTGLAALRFHRSPDRHCWAHVLLRQTHSDKVEIDIRLLSETGQPLVEIAGLRLEPLRIPPPVPSDKAIPLPPIDTAVVSRAALLAIEAPGRHALLHLYLRQQFASALRIPETRLDDSVPVGSLGLDSLMLVNLGTKLEQDLGVKLEITDFIAGPSVSTLTETLLEALTRKGQ